ncbi:4'-phosphopantetheinyl transferase family protein [Micromonospora cathayae]|uniref:4'-phosphopantetheinyl transferase superfamily protein n=1 Tax=Micromonospora cathayae TaxID=3028804 RepID=A0ABY7ZXS6_9ACTN|nr:4'-phosphopantetheinyl transferase superfamily protein [Micromonospora sp. HUAS 3]WDZ86559.1 4'-phosphopantetheinyl transferase superfamily protein [Micromonospora sp. HUAS 3]
MLPAPFGVAEVFGDRDDVHLYPVEETAVTDAVPARRREFTTGRHCARQALAGLGLPPGPIPAGPRREPVWPDGVVGSITHCTGYRAAAVARVRAVVAVGVDAEPHEPLPAGLLAAVASPVERARLTGLAPVAPTVCWDRLLFSAKESVYKAWYPLTRRPLGFDGVELTICPSGGTFRARLPVAGPLEPFVRRAPAELTGRWRVTGGLVLTAVIVPAGVT